MTHKCELIEDLLPLYIEDACSGESGRIIKEHLEECPQCRRLLQRLDKDTFSRPEELGVEEVLKRTSYILSKRAVYSALGVLAAVVFWLVFFWQERLAAVGDYRYFPYRFHEMISIGILVVPAAVLIWFLLLLNRTRKEKSWRRNSPLLLVLLLLVSFHTGYFLKQQGNWSTSGLYEIQEVPDDYHIIIEHHSGPMVLEVSPMVANLVKTDGTAYMLTFIWNERSPDKGVLENIEITDIRWG